MPKDQPPTEPSQTAEAVARRFFGAGQDDASIKRAIRLWLSGIVWAVVLIPLIFYLRFGTVGPVGWGLAVFFVVYCLLSAVGLYFLRRPEYHTPVKPRNDVWDRIGAFWLIACALGPFLGWILTSVVTLTVDNWRGLYAGRVILSIGLPVLTALPLTRYVRGRGAIVMIVLLVGVTALPVLSSWATWQDLWSGPVKRSAESYLPYTGQALAGVTSNP